MSSSVIHSPLNVLRTAQQIMRTQYPDVDVQGLYRKVDEGLYLHASNEQQKKAAEENAERAYEIHVAPMIPDFALLLEAVAPTLIKFSYMTNSTKDYLENQIAQASYLRDILIAAYVLIIVIMIIFVFKAWQDKPLREAFITVIIFIVAFYAIHALMFTMEIMLRSRINGMKSVNVSMLDKIEAALGRNVFVKFAEAYSRGEHKKFVTEWAENVLSEEQDETDDLIYDFCAQQQRRDGVSGRTATRECIISPCPNYNNIEEVLQNYVRKAWERRRDVIQDCDRMMLDLLHALAEVHSGGIFESNDPFSMWRGIQNGVDDIRDLMLRASDVNDTRRAYSDSEKFNVIKNEVYPKFILDVTECTDLRPSAKTPPFDPAVRSKEVCWRRAIDDPRCVWAYYEPCRGCVMAMENCDKDEEFCVPIKDPEQFELEYAPRESGADENDPAGGSKSIKKPKGTLLIKVTDEHKHKPLFVKGARKDAKMPSHWVPVRVGDLRNAAGGDALSSQNAAAAKQACVDAGDECGILDHGEIVRCRETASPDPAPDSSTSSSSSDRPPPPPSMTPVTTDERTRAFKTPKEGVSYKEVLDGPPCALGTDGGDDDDKKRLLRIKTTPEHLFSLNIKSHTYSTFFARSDDITRNIVNTLKAHHGAVRLEKFHDYIHQELRWHYGEDSYALLRALVNDVIRKVEISMDDLKPPSSDRGLFVTVTRFEEKLRALTYTETKDMVRKLGSLSKVTRMYANKHSSDEGSSQDRSVSNVFLLWSAAFVLILLFGLVLYNAHSIKADSQAGYIFRNVAMSICLFVFSLVVLGTIIARHLANKRFNEKVSDNNGKLLVNSSVRAMDVAAHHLEYMAHKRRMSSNDYLNEQILRKEFVELYRETGHVARSKALERNPCKDDSDKNDNKDTKFRTELADEPANLQELYAHMRNIIKAYDSCNTLTVPDDPPFPTFEITMYALVAFIALAMLFYSYARIDPLARVRNIHSLNDVREKIKSGMPSPSDLSQLAKCFDVKKDAWATTMNIVVVIMVVLIFIITYFIVHSSANYENSLYMSGLYADNKCKP